MKIRSPLLGQSTYSPNRFLNELMRVLHAPSDQALADRLGIAPSSISKVRNKHLAVTAELLLVAHLETGIPIRNLRDLMGDFSRGYWMGNMGGASAGPSSRQPEDTTLWRYNRYGSRDPVIPKRRTARGAWLNEELSTDLIPVLADGREYARYIYSAGQASLGRAAMWTAN